MSPNPLSGWSRLGFSGLVVLALVLAAAWRSPVAGPPVVDVGDLVAEPEAHLGSEVVVTGEWEMTAPTQSGYMMAVLRGRDGGRVACHFEDVPTADRNGLETYLLRTREVVVFGCCDGVEDGRAVLRDCRLID